MESANTIEAMSIRVKIRSVFVSVVLNEFFILVSVLPSLTVNLSSSGIVLLLRYAPMASETVNTRESDKNW
ncbi:hypothetical protein FHEFKHOI_02016 [Candidatus Methanoperedenaceae archaeon GB50]|nr:hypothetical protein FHEFKHOI_02016 [Candidatus Methanoperedenaceae archaeon GB50]